MTVWREVQEALYQRWTDQWVDGGDPRTLFAFEDEEFDPPAAPWARFSVKRMPGGQGTLGRPGNRKMDRVGMVFIQLFKPPGGGVGDLSDLGDIAAKVFENCRIATHHIRFSEVEPGETFDSDKGRWLALSVEGRFDYEELV